MLLFTDLEAVAGEVRRLFGPGCDPYLMIANDPSLVYKLQKGESELGPPTY